MTNSKIKIKQVTISDLNRVYELLNELYCGKIDHEGFVIRYNEKLSKTDSYNIVALFDNKIVGVCTSDLQTKLRRAKKQCFIEDLIVDQNYRNIGVGTSLLKNVIEFAKQQDCEVVKLSSFISNVNAHKLYEKNGFVKQSYEFKLNL